MVNFEKSIPAINKIVFTIGGFERGYETRTLSLDGGHLYEYSAFVYPHTI